MILLTLSFMLFFLCSIIFVSNWRPAKSSFYDPALWLLAVLLSPQSWYRMQPNWLEASVKLLHSAIFSDRRAWKILEGKQRSKTLLYWAPVRPPTFPNLCCHNKRHKFCCWFRPIKPLLFSLVPPQVPRKESQLCCGDLKWCFESITAHFCFFFWHGSWILQTAHMTTFITLFVWNLAFFLYPTSVVHLYQ